MAAEVVISLLLALLMGLTLSSTLQAQGPALTTISDTVYRADGTAASGTVLISWPSFQSAGGDAVAAGNLSVTIGPAGALTAQLVPNVGASPAGTYYVVVFQLDDGTVRREYWAVPSTSPTTIAAVLTTPGTGLANFGVTQQEVNAAVSGLAATVVHLAGTETITGTKQFSAPPSLPTPVGTNDAANKGYVDAAVSNVGSGAYVAIAGGTMTGPLTLPGDPTAPSQATDRHYVDNGLSVKADLVNGTVPSGELGAGVASAATCLTGNSTWGSCGGGAPAGITYATTALNWTQTISSSLTGGSQATVTLTPCPAGIDTTSGAGYQVLLSGGGNSEAVNVAPTPGDCTSGASSGTIHFTPFYSYSSGYVIGSASSGLQETVNQACGTNATTWKNAHCNVTIPASGPGSPTSINTYNLYGTLFWHANESSLTGYGAVLNCVGTQRGPCVQVGDRLNSNDFVNNTIEGLTFAAPNPESSLDSCHQGVAITNTAANGSYKTFTTAVAHNCRAGDLVTVRFTDDVHYWGDGVIVDCGSGSSASACNGSSTTFRMASSYTIASQATPGVVAIAFAPFLDNAENTHFLNITSATASNWPVFNTFFDLWDDENVTISHFNNTAHALNHSATWSGAFVFSGGAQNLIGSGLDTVMAPVITLRDSNITANDSEGVSVYDDNGVYIENTVLQASGLWQVHTSVETSGYGKGAHLKNIYSESSVAANPCSPTTATTPFPCTGIAGWIVGPGGGSGGFELQGNAMAGGNQSGGSGSTVYSYFIVANECGTALVGGVCPAGSPYWGGTHTNPMPILNWSSTGSDAPVVNWPRVADQSGVMSYDVLRCAGLSGNVGGVGTIYAAPGGSALACGSVATGLTQSSACTVNGGLVCTYTDSGAAATSAYTINAGNYGGALHFWPGSIVSVGHTVNVSVEQGGIVAVSGTGPVQQANACDAGGTVSAGGGFTSCLVAVNAQSGTSNMTATLMADNYGPGAQNTAVTGRLNFPSQPSGAWQAHQIITLMDSNPALTTATIGYRRPASVNDAWIGTDSPHNTPLSTTMLAIGAGQSITQYIANIGSTGTYPYGGAGWLERLTSSLKEFNVPAKFDQSVTLAGLSNGCLNLVSNVIASTGSPCGSGGGGGSVSSVFGRSGVVVASSGDYSVAQVTGAAADSAVVHLANPETITGAKTFTSNVTMSGNLLLPQGNGYVPAVGGIGLDTAAGLPVFNIGGTTQQVALTSSNISGQAGTALALAATPTQCSGSFATGIAANGNANCTTPDVIQLAETTPPAGIPNWGVFWFDSSKHAPFFIDNSGQAVQLGLTNLFNSDPGGDNPDNLEERNGTTAQNLRVYSSYTSSAWQRTALGYDTADNYAVVKSEAANSSLALGLGFWIGSGLKWVVDATGVLKPWTDNQFNFGSDTGNALQSVFAKTSFNTVTKGRNDFEIPNDATTGTAVDKLAVFNTNNPSQAVLASASSTNGVIGVVQGGAGVSGNAVVTWHGYAYCIFDNATTAGDAVIASTSNAGDCHDTGSGAQPSAQLIGYVDVTNATSGQTNGIRISLHPAQGGGGAVASVFGRSGAVTAAIGDYSVSQVTGAAVDSAVVHLAGAETITGAKTFSSDVTLSGNLNVAGNINQSGSGPTQWSGQEWTGTTVTVPSGMTFSLGVGSDNTFRCQLTSGASCLASGGGSMVYPGAGISNSTGSAWGTSYGTSGTGATLALTASPVFTGAPIVPGYVTAGTTVNGHALSSNVTVSAADLTTGTLPHAQLPGLLSGDIPNNAANTSGTAANLSGTPTLPSGTILPGYPTTGTLVTGNYAKGSGAGEIGDSGVVAGPYSIPWPISLYTGGSTTASFNSASGKAQLWGFGLTFPESTTQFSYYVQTADTGNCTYDIGVLNTSGNIAASGNAHIGNTSAAAGGFNSVGWHTTTLAGSSTLQPGKYYIATTASATSGCAVLGAGSMPTFLSNTAETVSSGGTLNNGITIPADSVAVGSVPSIYLR
jgi:hypothetical protein